MHPAPNAPVLEFLGSRRSVTAKTLTGPGPDRAALGDLLTMASRVPDHGKLVPWRFAIVMPEAQSAFADAALTRMADLGEDPGAIDKARVIFTHGVPIVAVVFSPKPSGKIPVWEQEMAAASVCLSLVNAGLAAGWGANWLSGPLSRDAPFLTDTLGCGPGEWVPGFIHLGTPKITPADRDRPDVEVLTTWL